MNIKPIYIFLISLAGCLLSACSSDEADHPDSGNRTEMSFDTSFQTRASVTTDIDRFAVYGDMKSPGENSIPVALFNYAEVLLKDGKWVYDNTQYWAPKREHSFVAISPLTMLDAANTPRYSNSHFYFEYAIPAAGGNLSSNGDVTDILIATHRRYYDNTANPTAGQGKVTFKFGHILSLINFSAAFSDNIMSSDAYVQIHKLEFSGVTTKAGFDIVPAPRLTNTQTDDRVMEVTGQETGNIAISFPTPVRVNNIAANVSLFADKDAVIMLPQTFAAASEAKINISYTISGDPSMRQASMPLKNLRWESGNSYVYKFTIERTGVKFNDCEINPWNRVEGDEITVD